MERTWGSAHTEGIYYLPELANIRGACRGAVSIPWGSGSTEARGPSIRGAEAGILAHAPVPSGETLECWACESLKVEVGTGKL